MIFFLPPIWLLLIFPVHLVKLKALAENFSLQWRIFFPTNTDIKPITKNCTQIHKQVKLLLKSLRRFFCLTVLRFLIQSLPRLFLLFKKQILRKTMPFVPVCIYSVALSIVHAEQFKQEIILLLKSLRIQFVISAIGVITLTNNLLLPISKSINMLRLRFM